MNTYFIMMNNQAGTTVMPIVNDREEVELFKTFEDAEALAKEHSYCQAFGYEIFCLGCGE